MAGELFSSDSLLRSVEQLQDDGVAFTVLIAAVNTGNLPAVRFLADRLPGSVLERRDTNRFTVLHHAVCAGNYTIVTHLITLLRKQGMRKLAVTDSEQWTCLHLSSRYGHVSLCKYFMNKHHIPVNSSDVWGYTPLHYACERGNLEVIECLMEAHANPYVTSTGSDADGLTPEDVAMLCLPPQHLIPVLSLFGRRKHNVKSANILRLSSVTNLGSQSSLFSGREDYTRLPEALIRSRADFERQRSRVGSSSSRPASTLSLSAPTLPATAQSSQQYSNSQLSISMSNSQLSTSMSSSQLPISMSHQQLPTSMSHQQLPTSMSHQQLPTSMSQPVLPPTSTATEAPVDSTAITYLTMAHSQSRQPDADIDVATFESQSLYNDLDLDESNFYNDSASDTSVKMRVVHNSARPAITLLTPTVTPRVTDRAATRTRDSNLLIARSQPNMYVLLRDDGCRCNNTLVKQVVETATAHTTPKVNVNCEARQRHDNCSTPHQQAIYLDNGIDNTYEVLFGVNGTDEGQYTNMAAKSVIHRLDTVTPTTEINNQMLTAYNISAPFEEFNSSFDDAERKTLQNILQALTARLLSENWSTAPLCVDRSNIFQELISAYESSDEMCFRNVAVTTDNLYSNQTVFASFWAECLEMNFCGESAMIPIEFNNNAASPKNVLQWRVLGRILSHGLALSEYIPVKLCRSALYFILTGDSNISPDVLINDFLLYTTQSESALLRKLLSSSSTRNEEDSRALQSFFSHYGLHEVPAEPLFDLKKQVEHLARYELLTTRTFVYNLIRDGVPEAYKDELRQSLTLQHLTHMYKLLTPTPRVIASLIRITSSSANTVGPEDECRMLNEESKKTLYSLRHIIESMSAEQLARFLFAVTHSDIVPRRPIRIEFHTNNSLSTINIDGSGVIVLPVGNYRSLQELKKELFSVII